MEEIQFFTEIRLRSVVSSWLSAESILTCKKFFVIWVFPTWLLGFSKPQKTDSNKMVASISYDITGNHAHPVTFTVFY
jgi:hypothetical protein